ncbi:hypothetical protein CVT24_005392 [Panaeolus cyanescens]|uniref:Galactose oxidase-like Early set domain-containing protein n=1 Tax=Panaeolus cyanescens TaxID=181874 RepID=A0A409Y8G7_9AGAR|nr:hypothetical protein CVT24_005392 [Panaeolus cyanescens]
MLSPPLSLLALCLATLASTGSATGTTGGTFADGGNTLVSAMMMFVGNEERVYILDKAEGNAAQVAGHPAWGSVWDVESHQATVMDVRSNVFCSSGMHLPNGSYITLGGNGAVGPGGNIGSQLNPGGFSAAWDAVYQDFDGTRAIRVLNPCRNTDNFNAPNCQWFDDATILSMKRGRWYSAAEATGDGRVVIIGGFTSGGYVNRNYPNTDPAFEGGAADPTYEYFPPVDGDPQTFNFMIQTSGLNAYAHTFLMPSGKMFVQANISTVLWDHENNVETPFPDMPGGVARVYPASGAVAMLPLTPANNYIPTILFCGGSDMPEYAYGNYSFPFIDTWNYPASRDCQRITPEPQDGSTPAYITDDEMLDGRTMGQFIILPDGKLLVVNGGANGTAGYSQATLTTPNFNDMPFGESLASGPVLTPAIYDPNAPKGSRWTNAGLGSSNIPRLYHSSAILLPDASVLIAGSNPNVDVNLTTFFPTTYQAEIFYPPYFSSSTRPVPTGIPQTLSYGGPSFDITLPPASYSGSANDAADSIIVAVMRSGFTTHAMNMGQRFLQLNNTYTVNQDGTITVHTSQLPPNPNLFQPGPAFVYVTVGGIPSTGTYVIVGNGAIGQQPTAPNAELPASVRLTGVNGFANGGGNGTDPSTDKEGDGKSNTGAIIGGVVAAVAALALIGAIAGICLARRRRANRQTPLTSVPYSAMSSAGAPARGIGGAGYMTAGPDNSDALRRSDTSAFMPLSNQSEAWNASTHSLSMAQPPFASHPYRDAELAASGSVVGSEYDTRQPMGHAPNRF